MPFVGNGSNPGYIGNQGGYLYPSDSTNTPDTTKYWYIYALHTHTENFCFLALRTDMESFYVGKNDLSNHTVTWKRVI